MLKSVNVDIHVAEAIETTDLEENIPVMVNEDELGAVKADEPLDDDIIEHEKSLNKDPSLVTSHRKNSTGVDGACEQELLLDTPKVGSSNQDKIDADIDVCKQEAQECKVVTVWALVSLDSCLRSSLSSNDLKAVEGIFNRLDHLRKNIVKLEFGSYNTRSGNDVFCHDLQVKVAVDTSSLWDSARKYIWKFLGQDEWTLGDGTIFSVSRIHVKH